MVKPEQTFLIDLNIPEGILITKALNYLWSGGANSDIEDKALEGIYGAGNALLLRLISRVEEVFSEQVIDDFLTMDALDTEDVE